MKSSWLWSGILLAATVMAPSVATASEAEVHNLSNDTIYVAVAYNRWKGDVAVEGWWAIEPNKEVTFRAADGDEMYLRIEKSGSELIFAKHKTYLEWYVSSERFMVSKVPDDATIRVLRWGADLGNSMNINANDRYPGSWDRRRFFKVGSGTHHFHIRP